MSIDPQSATGTDGIQRAFLAAADRIKTEADAEAAYRSASHLRDEMDRLVGEAATLRAGMALRVWSELGPMSLSQLATRLGTSKARADQLLRIARGAVG